jgi:hypothetical protein
MTLNPQPKFTTKGAKGANADGPSWVFVGFVAKAPVGDPVGPPRNLRLDDDVA